MAQDDIRALKAVLGVFTDVELAAKLGVERSTVAQWKRRGAVPSKYAYLLGLAEMPSQTEKSLGAVRHQYLGRAENHWLLKVALGFMPIGPDSVMEDDEATLGEYRERVVILLMAYAAICSAQHLGRSYPRDVGEYELLVRRMNTQHRNSIDAIVSSLRANPPAVGPQ